MASTTKPTIVFAPGAWHTPDCFDLVRDALKTRGWETEAVDYPSVGAEPPTKGLADDAGAIRGVLETLANEGKQIVLVVHSYGGLTGANAVQGLGWNQRAKDGKTGGVILYVYLSAFVTPLGKSIKEMLGGQFLPWMKFTDVRDAQTPRHAPCRQHRCGPPRTTPICSTPSPYPLPEPLIVSLYYTP